MSQSATHKNTVAIRCAFIIWLAALVTVSIFPLSFKLKLHTVGPLHDYSHYAAFVVTSIFLWLIAERPFGRALGFVGGLIFSYSQEWVENWLYHAGFEWRDVMTDCAGMLTGFALMLLLTVLLPATRD